MMKSKPTPNGAPMFEVPEGMELPEDAQPGATFEALATLQVESDGSLSLKAVDGFEVKPSDLEDASEEVEEAAEEEDDLGFVDAVERRAARQMEE